MDDRVFARHEQCLEHGRFDGSLDARYGEHYCRGLTHALAGASGRPEPHAWVRRTRHRDPA